MEASAEVGGRWAQSGPSPSTAERDPASNLASGQAAEHLRRLLGVATVASTLIQLGAVVSVWGRWPAVALAITNAITLGWFNARINLSVAPRADPNRVEWLRFAGNVPGMLLHGYLVDFGVVYWLWLPFLALLNEASRIDQPHRRNLAYLIALAGLPLAAGAPWRWAALFAPMSVFLHLVSLENARFARAMIRERDANLHDLRRIQSKSERRAFERDAANQELERRLAELRATQRQLLEASRRAGMAEVATSVLHNVGNVLNSVNVSAGLLASNLDSSRLAKVLEAIDLLLDQEDPARFLDGDPRGKHLLTYLRAASDVLRDERARDHEEVDALVRGIQHIKNIVQVQQAHARSRGRIETLDVAALLDEALELDATSHAKHGIQIERGYAPGVRIECDRHRVLQILLNLLSNASHAVKAGASPPRIVVRLRDRGPDEVAIEVEDGGIGITPENMANLFQHGFTTKPDGHGFGLHASACTATELGGELTAQSAGRERGARFTLVLPRRAPANESGADLAAA